MRYFLKLAYDGTPFHGWQRQPNAMSVQQKIEDSLSIILQNPTEICGAGRTDAGVHAREMYAHVDLPDEVDPTRLLSSLARMVGPSIAIYDLLPVRSEGHARFDAISRSYKYYITMRRDPFLYNYAHLMERTPDVERMNEAARVLLQTSDFTSFAKLHSDALTNICKVSKAEWSMNPESGILVFEIKADRFLRNMVRAVVGTLIEVGTGKLTIDGFMDVIEAKDRCHAGVSMPAKGLFLEKIVYPKEIFIL